MLHKCESVVDYPCIALLDASKYAADLGDGLSYFVKECGVRIWDEQVFGIVRMSVKLIMQNPGTVNAVSRDALTDLGSNTLFKALISVRDGDTMNDLVSCSKCHF